MIVWKRDLKLMETRVIVVVRSLRDAVSLKVGNLSYLQQNRKMVIMIEVNAATILFGIKHRIKPAILSNQWWTGAKTKARHFSHHWDGGSGGLNFHWLRFNNLTQIDSFSPRNYDEGSHNLSLKLTKTVFIIMNGYLTIIPWARVGYEMIDSQRGA